MTNFATPLDQRARKVNRYPRVGWVDILRFQHLTKKTFLRYILQE